MLRLWGLLVSQELRRHNWHHLRLARSPSIVHDATYPTLASDHYLSPVWLVLV